MKKALLGLVLVTFLAGCSSISKFLPSNFDNVEFGKLVELNVVAELKDPAEPWCNPVIINQMNYRSLWLVTYSKYRLNDNIAEIYKQIHGITKELKERENPSDAYCRIKRQSIHRITTDVLEVFGSRKT